MPATRRDRAAGFALLLVLWTVVLLALITATMTAAGRGDVRLAENLRDSAMAQAAADGAVYATIFHLAAGEWTTGSVPHRLRIGDAAVSVMIDDEAGKIDVNDVPAVLMQALLTTLGLESRSALALSEAIEDYRSSNPEPQPLGAKAPQYRAAGLPYGPAGVPFTRLDQLRLVLGMTPEIYARLAPHLAIYTPGAIDLRVADRWVAAAYRQAGPNGGYPDARTPLPGLLIAQIHATATLAGRAAAHRVAVVRFDDSGQLPARPPIWRMLDWNSGSDP
jgi:general secretion pathway protein K